MVGVVCPVPVRMRPSGWTIFVPRNGALLPLFQLLYIAFRGCEHDTVLLIEAEGHAIQDQHCGHLMLDALRLPFLDFVCLAHNLKFCELAFFSYL